MPDVIIPDPNLDPAPGEINVLRRQTEQYIKQNRTDVVLVRHTKVSDGAGGTKSIGDQFQLAQMVRIIQNDETVATERRTVDGESVRPTLNMLCAWDANVQVGDQFEWNGFINEVVYITDMRYELTCEVAVRHRAS